MTGRVATGLSTAVWIVSLVIVLPYLQPDTTSTYAWSDGGGLLDVTLAVHLDALSARLVLLVTTVTVLVQLFSTSYMRGDPRYRSYTALIGLFEVAMLTVVVADDLFVLLVGWEVMGLCSWLLIGHHWELPAARAGAVKAFVMTRFGDLGLLVAIVVTGQAFDTYRISEVLAQLGSGERPPAGIGLLLVLAVVGKSALFPLHTWLADAMPGPTPISALIHAATMVVAGVYLVARLLPLFTLAALTVLALVAALTMVLGALFALVQTDLKRLLAWSTVSQLAYMYAALAASDADAAIDHLLSHGAFKALLFLVAGTIAHATGSTALRDMGALRRSMPRTFATATVGLAALAGVVPTSGFFSKDAVLAAVQGATAGDGPLQPAVAWLLLAAGLVTVVLTAAYATRAWLLVFFGVAGQSHERAAPADPGAAMVGPLVVLGVLTLALSLSAEPHVVVGIVTTVLLLVGAAASGASWRAGRDPAVLAGPARAALERELDIDDRYLWLAGTVRRAGTMVVAGDRDVIDAYPRGVGALARLGSGLLHRTQARNAQSYATVLAIGALAVAVAVIGR